MIDFTNDVLRHCGGRLTVPDSELLYKTAMELNPKNILEIGSFDGCSTMILGSIAKMTDGKVQCIEPAPKQKWRWNIERLQLQEWVEMIFASSPWVPTSIIRTPIDYLFIDGDHRTRWCLVDYHFWMPFVRIGGRIAFHDWGDAHQTGDWVREAVSIILRDDAQFLKEIGQTTNTRGLIVFEKTGDHKRYA